jgi:predicted Holliday junction resolvase-like endonuclease
VRYTDGGIGRAFRQGIEGRVQEEEVPFFLKAKPNPTDMYWSVGVYEKEQ